MKAQPVYTAPLTKLDWFLIVLAATALCTGIGVLLACLIIPAPECPTDEDTAIYQGSDGSHQLECVARPERIKS